MRFISVVGVTLMMILGLLSLSSPAQARTTYSDCVTRNATVSFEDYYASAYPGKLADGKAKVVWDNCRGSDGSNRSNAKYVVFSVRCDNPGWINGLVFNLGNIEGMDLPNKMVHCNDTNWVHKRYDLRTPGFIHTINNWNFSERRDCTTWAKAQFVPEIFENHGPFRWGGRYNFAYSV